MSWLVHLVQGDDYLVSFNLWWSTILKDKNVSLILRGATGFVKNAKSIGPTSLFTFFYRF